MTSEEYSFKNDPRSFSLVGKAGEYAVASQMLLRQLVTFFPAVDTGVDLIAENGCRIQVKTSRKCVTYKTLKKNSEGVYRFKFPKVRYRNTSTRSFVGLGTKTSVKPFHEFCDVVVLWGVEENRFWIVPARMLEGVTKVDLGPDNSRGFSKDVPEMRAMLAAGNTQDEVAKHFGISQAAVSIRLKREGSKIFISKRTAAVRACENAWDHILNYGEPDPEYKPGEVQEEVHHGLQLEQATLLSECASTQ